MFFHIVLDRNMQLHPRHFGPHLHDKLVSKLIKDVEGMCSGRHGHGFVVAITGVEDIGKGLIREGTGYVTFPVKYQCVVFRPFKGEILEAVVTSTRGWAYADLRVQPCEYLALLGAALSNWRNKLQNSLYHQSSILCLTFNLISWTQNANSHKITYTTLAV